MLSILIPTYNYDCLGLVEELHRQAQTLSFPIEILVADDGSSEEFKRNNRKINRVSNCKFIELKENVGRAKIRNFLSEKAQYNLLLFIDSDAGLVKKDFLQNYIYAAQNSDVVCGGLIYDRPIPSVLSSLRYYYGIYAEERSARKRNLHPYSQFSSFSFLIKKRIFQKILFDESFTEYGHEDTAFGMELEKQGVRIKHIDNPLYHLGLERNDDFLRKTEKGIETLYCNSALLFNHVRLLQAYKKLKKYRVQSVLATLFRLTERYLRDNLLSTHPNMRLFAFYKLGYLCNLEYKQKSTK